MQATGSGFMFIYDDDFVLRSQLLPQWSVAGFLTKTAVFHGSETDLHASRRPFEVRCIPNMIFTFKYCSAVSRTRMPKSTTNQNTLQYISITGHIAN